MACRYSIIFGVTRSAADAMGESADCAMSSGSGAPRVAVRVRRGSRWKGFIASLVSRPIGVIARGEAPKQSSRSRALAAGLIRALQGPRNDCCLTALPPYRPFAALRAGLPPYRYILRHQTPTR